MEVVVLGPSLSDPGGMASVEQDLLDLLKDKLGWAAKHIPTYTSRSRPIALIRFVGSAWFVARTRLSHAEAPTFHLHLSQRGSFVRGLVLTSLLARQHRLVVTIHGSRFRPWAAAQPWLATRVLARADVVTVLSSATADVVRSLTPHTDVRVVPNFVEPSPLLPDSAGSPILISAGEVSTRKGFDILFAAWRAVVDSRRERDWKLLVAGPIVDVQVPEHESIEYLGVLPRRSIRQLIGTCRAGVLASRAEAMPMFVLETMAAGKPVLSSDIESLASVIGEGGTTFSPGDIDELACSMRRVLEDEEFALELGRRAWRRIRQTYSPDAIAATWREIYAPPSRTAGASPVDSS
jgi:glycosyltransferase involved in cell wall biosynthesis